jgi:rhodanese-related sulfurtransferase
MATRFVVCAPPAAAVCWAQELPLTGLPRWVKEEGKSTMSAMQTIDREELKNRLEGGESLKLILVQGRWAFERCHIPGSITFASREAALAVLHPDDEIVVYCAGGPCPASAVAYRLLTERGYRQVRHYPGGLADWAAAGYPLAGELAAEVRPVAQWGRR